MMQTRDWVSGLVGLIVFLLGLFPFLASFGRGPDWWGFSLPIAIAGWIVAIGGFYLLMNSFIEITNSNIVGWVSLCVAGIISESFTSLEASGNSADFLRCSGSQASCSTSSSWCWGCFS